jgi:hypothetical protein
MPRYFPLLFVCAILVIGGCHHKHRAPRDDPYAVEPAATTGSQERRAKEPRATEPRTNAKGRRTDGQNVTSDDGRVKGKVYGSPHQGSKFINLRIGMSRARVESMIGPGTDTKGYVTGKAFTPFYYGRDAYRIEHFYKGSGRLAFSAGNKLVVIVHDADEDGFSD